MQQYTSLKIKIDNPELTLKEVFGYLNGYAPQQERKEKDLIYLPNDSHRFHTMKLRDNDSYALQDGVKTMIAELPGSAGLPLFRNNLVDIVFNIEEDYFNNMKDMLGKPDCILERNRLLIYKMDQMDELRIYLDTDIKLEWQDYKKFTPKNKGFLEFKIPYTHDLAEKQAYLWDLAEKMHFTVDQFEPRSYYEMKPSI